MSEAKMREAALRTVHVRGMFEAGKIKRDDYFDAMDEALLDLNAALSESAPPEAEWLVCAECGATPCKHFDAPPEPPESAPEVSPERIRELLKKGEAFARDIAESTREMRTGRFGDVVIGGIPLSAKAPEAAPSGAMGSMGAPMESMGNTSPAPVAQPSRKVETWCSCHEWPTIAALRAELWDANQRVHEYQREVERREDIISGDRVERDSLRADLEAARGQVADERESAAENEQLLNAAAKLALDRKAGFDCWADIPRAVEALKARADAAEKETAKMTDRAVKLEAFKAYVHRRLDSAGIPTHPDGPHSKAGCRIGDRLDLLIGAKDAAEKRAEEAVNAAVDENVHRHEAEVCLLAFIEAADAVLAAFGGPTVRSFAQTEAEALAGLRKRREEAEDYVTPETREMDWRETLRTGVWQYTPSAERYLRILSAEKGGGAKVEP